MKRSISDGDDTSDNSKTPKQDENVSDSGLQSSSRPLQPIQQNIANDYLREDKDFKKLEIALKREKDIEFEKNKSSLTITLSAVVYGEVIEAFKRFYERSKYEVAPTEITENSGKPIRGVLKIKDPNYKKQKLGITFFHTTKRILVNGSMYCTDFPQHLDQIIKLLPDSEEMQSIKHEMRPPIDQSSKKENQSTSIPGTTTTKEEKSLIPASSHPMRAMLETTRIQTATITTSTINCQPSSSDNGQLGSSMTQSPAATSSIVTRSQAASIQREEGSVPSGGGSMPKIDADIIQDHFKLLIKELNPIKIADHLFQAKIFDLEEYEEISCISDKGQVGGMRRVLTLLLKSGKSAFPAFVEALRNTGNDHVLEEMFKPNRDSQ